MTSLKVLALGSAGVLAAFSGAEAADLPLAEPVEYVKVCDTYGAGYFYIPGGDTCLKVAGLVRAEYVVVQTDDDRDNLDAFRSRARVAFDARTATEYGLLRSYIRLQFDQVSPNRGIVVPYGGRNAPFDYAFVQFAGLTAGYTDSFFDFKPDPSYVGQYVSDIQTLMLAYTAAFGSGFSATIALEDATYRSLGGTGATQGGQEMPDVVGNLRVEGAWGEIQASGAVHQIRAEGSIRHYTEYAWAAQGGAKVNLPMIGDGDFIYASGAYGEGALSYIFAGAGLGTSGNASLFQGVVVLDYMVDVNGQMQLTKAWNVNGGFEHYFSEQWRTSVSASYVDVEYPLSTTADFQSFIVAGQLVWSPVEQIDIGVELAYSEFFGSPEKDVWAGRLRVERRF